MNKKVALSILSATVVASMASSAFAAPKSGVYLGGDVDRYYELRDLFNLTDAGNKKFAADMAAITFDKLIYVDFDGKGASLRDIMNGELSKVKRDLKESDFEGVYTKSNLDGSNGDTYDPRKDATPVTGDLKVESVSAISKTTLKVNFNKAVDSVAKENFSIAGAVVNAATLSEDKKSVTLSVSGLTYETEYTVVAANILVDGKPVTLEGTKFKMPAVTDVYNLELTTDAPNDAILANGADNLVLTAKLKDKVTGAVDVNADNVVISFSSTYGNLANTRVTVQDGVATVVLTSEFSQKDLVSKVDAQIIEASGDYKDLIGKVVGTKNVHFKVDLGGGTDLETPLLTGAESNQADRVTLKFNQDVTVKNFVEFNEVTKKYVVDIDGNANLVDGVNVLVYQNLDNAGKPVALKVRGLKPVAGNTKALEVILDKQQVLEDNKAVFVEITQPSTNGEKKTQADFILTDARKPEATSVVSQGLKHVVVKYSEPVKEASLQLNGGLTKIKSVTPGEFNQETLEDTRDTATIETEQYLTAGTHSVQFSSIKDFAADTDPKNISTNQTLDFVVNGDDSIPTATVSVESPEQFRITFNKEVQDFELSDVKLQKLVKGTNGAADVWEDAHNDKVALEQAIDPESEYVFEMTQDWTKIYDTENTRKNYYNDQYRLVIAKDTVTNPANGKKNAEIVLPLNFSGSKLNSADTTSPVISGFDVNYAGKAITNFEVNMSEPVKLPSKDNATDTASQIQGTTVPTPIIEFLGTDKDGNAVTVKGAVVDYTGTAKADKDFIVKVADGQPTLESYVLAGGKKDWTLVVRSISDDVGNTAPSLTHNFSVDLESAAEVFMVKGNFQDKAYNGVEGFLNGAGEDTIVLDFTADVKYTGSIENAVNPSNYLLDGENLPKGTKLTVSDSDAVAGVDIVTITLPDGTLAANANNVITLNKNLKSAKGTKLTGEYEISFKPSDVSGAADVDAKIAALPSVADLKLSDEAAVKAARDAYNALPTAQRALVKQLEVLAAAEAKIAELKKTDQAAADLKAAQDAVTALETAADKDLTVEADLTAAEKAVKDAEAAVTKLAAGTDKDYLAAKITVAKKKVTDARAKFDADNAANLKAAQDAVATLETAAGKDLREEANLTAAETALADAKAKVAKVAAGADKTALEGKVTAAEKTVTDARKAFDDAKALEAAKTALNNAITAAQGTHDGATEGTATGEYAVGSKATLKAEIDKAQLVADNTTATKAELDKAKSDLDAAVATFEAGKVS